MDGEDALRYLETEGFRVGLAPDGERLMVGSPQYLTDSLREFIWQNKPAMLLALKIRGLKKIFAGSAELREQFEFEVEERTAIKVFDGGLSEFSARRQARVEVVEHWASLFIEQVSKSP